MPATQANRPMRVQTPLGPDQLLLTELRGQESLSRLFQYQLTLLAENGTRIEFDQLIGQPILVELDLPGGKKRYFHGICSRLVEGRRNEVFTRYRMEVVPKFWLLTRRIQSRIFQQMTVHDILKKVLAGLDVQWDLKGTYFERDFCVQYRESDFAFACRLMEEEGIWFCFAHSAKGHTLLIADHPQAHADVPEFPKAIFDDTRGGNRSDLRVTEWEKAQELRSSKITLWDHCFELPGQNLEAQRVIPESVPVGKVTHRLKLAGTEALEVFDYPGAYAQRFDGIDAGGGDRPEELEKIFQDNQRTAKIRIEQEAAAALEVRGTSTCAQFTAGHKFTLERHFNADGTYVLTQITHDARLAPDYRSGSGDALQYINQFSCIPAALTYRPPLLTPEPVIQGPQTATVVGSPGELIFCDKYGRVKVKFHWDREGKADEQSSCWVRVSQNWGGAKWGGMFIPHVGQEVIVEFEEGDPDRPLITGRVYNAAAMPPVELPGGRTKSVIRDHGGNEIIMEGEAGREQIRMHSPYSDTTFLIGAPHSPGDGFWFHTQAYMKMIVHKDWETGVFGKQDWFIRGNETMTILGNSTESVAKRKTRLVGGSDFLVVQQNEVQTINGVRMETTIKNRGYVTGGNEKFVVKKNRSTHIRGNLLEKTNGQHNEHVVKDHSMQVDANALLKVKGNHDLTIGGDWLSAVTGGLEFHSGKRVDLIAKEDFIVESETTSVAIQCGASSITLKHDGTITIKGKKIEIHGSDEAVMKSTAKIKVAGGDLEMRGSKIDGEASGLHRIHGGTVKINCVG